MCGIDKNFAALQCGSTDNQVEGHRVAIRERHIDLPPVLAQHEQRSDNKAGLRNAACILDLALDLDWRFDQARWLAFDLRRLEPDPSLAVSFKRFLVFGMQGRGPGAGIDLRSHLRDPEFGQSDELSPSDHLPLTRQVGFFQFMSSKQ